MGETKSPIAIGIWWIMNNIRSRSLTLNDNQLGQQYSLFILEN